MRARGTPRWSGSGWGAGTTVSLGWLSRRSPCPRSLLAASLVVRRRPAQPSQRAILPPPRPLPLRSSHYTIRRPSPPPQQLARARTGHVVVGTRAAHRQAVVGRRARMHLLPLLYGRAAAHCRWPVYHCCPASAASLVVRPKSSKHPPPPSMVQ